MNEMESSSWQRRGSSIIWSPELLRPLITGGDAVPLRTALEWSTLGFPDSPPGDRPTVLVGGLQTVLDAFPEPESAYQWLRGNVLPLVQACGDHWDRVGLVFGMDGPGKLFTLNDADDLVYFGKGNDRERKIKITRAIWNGAATGGGAYKILDSSKETGGFHVQRVS
jgi:hypothetical protein